MNEKILTHTQANGTYFAARLISYVHGHLEVSFGDVSGQTVNVVEEWGYITVVRMCNGDVLKEEIYADWEMFAIAYGLV